MDLLVLISSPPSSQRRSFFYLSGCDLPDCHLLYHVPSAKLALFIPPIDPDAVIWSGLPLEPPAALSKYDVDVVLPSSSLKTYFSDLSKAQPLELLIAIRTHDIDALHATVPLELSTLQPAIDTCRVVKDPYEIASVRHANSVSTAAHVAVLRALKTATNERELAAIFTERCIALGCEHQAYHGIFGAGTNAATLHYVNNSAALSGKWNLLVDAAAEWGCYCADVTRTMPLVGGRFNAPSRAIYEAVRHMQEACLDMVRAEVLWEDVHKRAHEIAVKELLGMGILRGKPREIIQAGTSVAFFPHGLGHYLGLDTHDTGGNPNYEDPQPMMRYLRVRGKLPAGSIITVEPGIYFCRFIVEPYLKDEKHKGYIDEEVLNRFWDVGGVRIEGD